MVTTMKTNESALTKRTMQVLAILMRGESVTGSAIAKETHLASGSLYPILNRLERAGWISSNKFLGDSKQYRKYSVTPHGAFNAREAAAEWWGIAQQILSSQDSTHRPTDKAVQGG